MPMTKVQIDKALDLFERFVEAHEALAETAVIMTTPTVTSGAPPSLEVPSGGSDPMIDEPAQGGDEPTADAGEDQGLDLDTLGSDDPALDISDAKAVKEFKETLGGLLREFGAANSPEETLDLIEQVAGTRKFSEVPDDKLEELHDSVYDAMEGA